MVFLSAMCLSQHTYLPIKTITTIFFKTAIFIAVLISCTMSNAQEYNNWLLGGGAVLNFDTSPATIICNKFEDNYSRQMVMLSDGDGQVVLYAFKTPTSPNASSSISDFVIKNKKEQTIVSFSCGDLRNAIGCKLPQGGYYIAAVLRTKKSLSGELHVYKFDNNANLEQEYVYSNGNYTFFIDFIRIGNYIVLVSYKHNQIETYKLTSDGCSLWSTSEIVLDQFAMLTVPYFSIEHSLDGTKIFVTAYDTAYILNFNKLNGKISITDRIESDKFRTMSLSKNAKYLLIIDDGKLKGYLYNNKFDFDFEKPDIVYDLPYVSEIDCDKCWQMAIGIDGKMYVHFANFDYIMVLDGIEEGIITEEIIKSNCLQVTFFPRIPRLFDTPSCNASAAFDNTYVCHGQPLNIISSGDAPFEISYTIDGEPHNITTSDTEYQLPDVAGKYKITKIKDTSCEFSPTENNEAEIAPQMKKLRIVEE